MGSASGPHPSAVRLRPLFRAWPVSDAVVTALSREFYKWGGYALAGRPTHGPSAEEVQVQVVDRLSRLRPLVEDHVVAVAIDLAFVRDAVGDLDHADEHRGVRRREVVDAGNVLLRNHQYMRRGDRTDIVKGDDLVVAEDFLRRDLPREDLAEETLLRHRPSLRAEQAVGATRQWTRAGDGTQRLAALGRIDRDVVIRQASHSGRKAPVPDRLEVTTDEA